MEYETECVIEYVIECVNRFRMPNPAKTSFLLEQKAINTKNQLEAQFNLEKEIQLLVDEIRVIDQKLLTRGKEIIKSSSFYT